MSYKCSVITCKNKYSKSPTSDGAKKTNAVSFFEFPSTPANKRKWLENIGRPYFKLIKSSRICSDHFDKTYLIRKNNSVTLKRNAVPLESSNSDKEVTATRSKHSEKNISLSISERVLPASVSEVPEIGIKRRRNTAYQGPYDFGIRKQKVRVTDAQKPQRAESVPKKSVAPPPANPLTAANSKNKKVAPAKSLQERLRSASVSKVPQVAIQRRRNTAFKGPYDFDTRKKTATDVQSPYRLKKVVAQPVPLTTANSKNKKVAPAPVRASSFRTSEKNISSNRSERLRSASANEVSSIGIQRRRNTAFKGPYDFGIRRRTITPDRQRARSAMENTMSPVPMAANSENESLAPSRLTLSSSRNSSVNTNKRALPDSVSDMPEIEVKRSRNTLPRPNDFGIGKVPRSQRTKSVAKKISPSVPRNQLRMDKFLTKSNNATAAHIFQPEESRREDCIFGWAAIGSHYVPFIVKDSEKYCAVRMLESSCLAKFKGNTPKIGPCHANLECFTPNRVQCDLLNEINYKHCDIAYGKAYFSPKDKLVRLGDADKYFTFVDLCHESHKRHDTVESDGLEFGFTLVNGKWYIPYTILREQKFIPLRYLHCDGEILELLKANAQSISGDDSIFLEFCCKFDGVSDVGESTEVVDLDRIKIMVPQKTTFENCWPTAKRIHQLRVVQTKRGIRLESA